MISPNVIDEAAHLADDALREINEQAVAKHNYVTAALTQFQMDLDKGEEEQILLRSSQ